MNKPPFQPPFVGESRTLLVDGLVSIYDQVIKSGEPRWVSFEAPSGWGKTRVVQEFYSRLASQQDKQYWPNTILDTLNIEKNHVAARRKRIFPDFNKIERVYGALPDFMWWGIACTERGVVASEVLLEDLEQLDTHKLYLEAAWAAHASFKEKYFPNLDLAKRGFSNALEESGAAGLAKTIEEIASTTVLGLGLLVKFVRWGIGSATRSIKKEKQLERSGSLAHSEKRDDLLEDAIAITIKLSQHIPTILFVEDFHLASPLTIQLIECLARSNAKVLIITASWPEQLNQHVTIQPLFKDTFIENRTWRVKNGEELPDVFPANASLDALPQNALQDIILSYYPEVETETLDRLAKRFNNPLPLELVCSLPQHQRQFPNLTLSTNEINRLPNTAKDIYQQIWNALNNETRQALTLATLGIPDGHSVWHKIMIQNAINQFEIIENKAAVASTFETAHLPKSWIRIIENWSQRLSEPDQLHLIRENIHDHFSDNEVNQFLILLAEEIGKQKFKHIDPAASHRAWLMLTLHAKGLTDGDTVFGAILFLQYMLHEFPRELPTRIWLGKNADKLGIEKNSTKMLQSRSYYAKALGESGQLVDAIEQYKDLLADQQRILGSDHLETLITRHSIAFLLGQSGQVSDAIAQLKTLLADWQRILGSDHLETLNTRHSIASLLGESGQVNDAIAQLKTLLADQQRILGADHPETLRTRNSIAYWLGQSGQVSDAIAQLKTLLADQQRILGADHPDTLRTRHNIASWLGESGQVNNAIAQLKTLLADRQRILGADHPDTLVTRNNMASWLGRSRQVANAIEQFKTLLTDQQRILGADHPDTLLTRGNMAVWLGEAGQLVDAIEQSKALLADQQRILGADHPDTLRTRINMASWMGRTGQVVDAIGQYKTLLADQQRTLGVDHPNTLRTRSNMVSWLGEAGHVVDAIEQSKALLADQQRILGADHPDTLLTCRYITYLLKE
jgi:Tetratricopeptide repeat